MNIFWYEFSHFVAYIFAVLVSIASVALFVWTVGKEGVLRTKWRPLGFFFLAVSGFVFVLERKFDQVGIAALLIQVLGFFFIYKGVLVETDLSHLEVVGQKKIKETKHTDTNDRDVFPWGFDHTYMYLAIAIIVILIAFFFARSFLDSVVILASIAFILLTIRIQIRRYREGSKKKSIRRQNLFPLVGYILLFVSQIFYILYRLPELNIVDLREFTIDYGFVWIAGFVFILLGFVFLAVWAWNYIKLRVFLRTYTVLLTLIILIATIGSLVNALLLFRIVERDNLNLMSKGARAEKTVMDDRQRVSMAFARTFADDEDLVSTFTAGDYRALNDVTNKFYDNSELDVLKVYHPDGDIVASPSDERDLGVNRSDDELFRTVLQSEKPLLTYYTTEGVLSPLVLVRAMHPIYDASEDVVGVVETGYFFDNAFVDFSKDKTNLDVTIYSNDIRSATTIQTTDEVSRWVGSRESNEEVLDQVLENQRHFATEVDRLGIFYYSAFEPIRNSNNQIIGMVSVGVPTKELLESSRQELLSSFLIVSALSILVAVLGYEVLKRYAIPEGVDIKE